MKRCKRCVDQDHNGNTGQCRCCKLQLPIESFSQNQLGKGEMKRCKRCVDQDHNGNRASRQVSGANVLDNAMVLHPTGISEPFAKNIDDMDKDELIRIVKVLNQENMGLKLVVGALSQDVARLTQENSKLLVQLQSVESLRNEIKRLELENGMLKKEITELKNDVKEQGRLIGHLMKAHKRESELAIRKLLDDAERITDRTIFSLESQAFISKHSSKLRREGDIAAHGRFALERIREAIQCHTKPTTKRILIDLFSKSYNVQFEEAEDNWISELDE